MLRIWRLRWYLLFGLVSLALLVNLALALIMRADWAVLGQAMALALFLAGSGLLYSDRRRDEAQRRLLLKVGEELAARADLNDLLHYVVEAILNLVPSADKCVVHLLDEPGRRLYPAHSSHPAWELSVGMPANKGIAGLALTEERTKVVADTLGDPEFLPLHSNADLRALMVAPLLAQGKPLGTISLNSKTPGAFTERDRALVTALAAQAATAIHQNRLYAKALSEAHYIEAIINNLADGLLVLDAEGRVLRHNPSLAHIVGTDVADIIGQKPDANSEDEGLRRLAVLLGDLPREAHTALERQVEVAEPLRASLRIHASPVIDQDGGREYIILIHDQTEELDLARAKSCLVGAAARELYPRLESVRGYATLLIAHDLAEQGSITQWASQIREESVRLVRLAEDLADVCALDLHKLEIKSDMVSVSEMVTDVLAEAEQPLRRKRLLPEVLCPPDLPRLPLDQGRICRVLLNLLENAIHRANPGGHISIKVEASLEEITFALADDGQPIPDAARARIFQGLYRSDGAMPEDPVGTGLGIYISRRIVEAYGGHLWLAETTARGAKFQFIVPLSVPQRSGQPA